MKNFEAIISHDPKTLSFSHEMTIVKSDYYVVHTKVNNINVT